VIALLLDEGERQMVLLALAHLSNERPGWDDLLTRIALRIDNVRGRAVMYDQFKTLVTGREFPVEVLGAYLCKAEEKP
jgi:hypothetical protein